ncbi:MAG TPA: type ISP restriction/modification enzyme [Blastocatellia bacterium]|nr:type ISP restriction/modification enzyme [Blastocatellia bacterium]
MNNGIERLKSIKTFPSLVKYLRDELDWPIESDDFEDLTYDYDAEELGIDAKTAAKIKEIKQLRPLTSNQPWGIFFINFEPKRLPIVALRRILRSLVIKKRASANKAQQATWHSHDLLFVSSFGEASERQISFAHFHESKETGDLPTLNVLGWNAQNTMLRLEDTHRALKDKLRWPADDTDIESWRAAWASAFALTYRYSIKTSKELSIELARLASVIRARVNEVLAVESERGQLRQLYKAFQEALIHDLSEDDFADMYAQTIAYGLLSARVSRESGALVADNVADMVPVTNPFLKELMQTFLTVGGRKSRIDFDELGINEVVELLRQANMESVLRDFGDRNPQEDPVIHFYELFLKEYDPVKRMKRGVFYTPRPVVSFIVRSVDEILRTEFGLEDGLADTTTWGEFIERQRIQNPKSKIQNPEGVKPDAPFVQILDPATGTGTFLVEVIEVIHRTMVEKWRRAGKREGEIRELWNEYVPKNLLPRLYGFELMMAPYAIAHMKIGLKLRETGYSFLSSERARIYLTNTLEEPKDFSDYFEQMAPALAHEANAANKVKRTAPITVVIGNPPYSGISGNMNPWIDGLLKGQLPDGTRTRSYYEIDGMPLGEKKVWLQDDYVKFIRYGQYRIDLMGVGVLGYISNHSYLDNPTFRGMRQQLIQTFPIISILDLHGNIKKERASDAERVDKNVFEIEQGVAIGLFRRGAKSADCYQVEYGDIWGDRNAKYISLMESEIDTLMLPALEPSSPFYFLVPRNEANKEEYEKGWKVTNALPKNSSGIVTARDAFVIDFDKETLLLRIAEFRNKKISDDSIRKKYFAGKGSAKYEDGDSRGWKLPLARAKVQADSHWHDRVMPILYRPFDVRNIYNVPWMVDWPRPEFMRHMIDYKNLGLITSRMTKGESFQHAQVTRNITEVICMSPKTSNNGFLFPLYLYDKETLLKTAAPPRNRRANLALGFIKDFSSRLNLSFIEDGLGDLQKTFGPEDIFHYIYAISHSPTYRTRYAEFLKIDFPRIPLTNDLELFRKLAAKGADLVALHLLEDDYEAASWNTASPKRKSPLKTLITKFAGTGGAEVAKGYPKYSEGNVSINPSRYFAGVPEAVWNFHIGGYQVCAKWLKDRRGRTLTDEDIAHYQRVVVALKETIRLMAEIDEVIEAHGGWPLPGSQDAPKVEPDQSTLPFA